MESMCATQYPLHICTQHPVTAVCMLTLLFQLIMNKTCIRAYKIVFCDALLFIDLVFTYKDVYTETRSLLQGIHLLSAINATCTH